jgi:hypothetical protein
MGRNALFYCENVRFAMCHTPNMDREYLLRLRNELVQTQLGDLLLKYLHDKATSEVNKKISRDDISGFLLCIQAIKDIPTEVDRK